MKINVIGVPLNLGCDRAGVERAPNHLRERGLMGVIRKNGHKAFDLGNLYVPPVSEADKFVRGNSMKISGCDRGGEYKSGGVGL